MSDAAQVDPAGCSRCVAQANKCSDRSKLGRMVFTAGAEERIQYRVLTPLEHVTLNKKLLPTPHQ